jgi:uncharacterized protein
LRRSEFQQGAANMQKGTDRKDEGLLPGMRKSFRWLALALACLATTAIGSGRALAGEVLFNQGVGGDYAIHVTSLKEARFRRVIKQEYDFSCGSAALATLLSFHYEMPVSETQVFTEMFKVGDQKRIEKYGFSLLDMKLYLEHHDIKADGFRVSLARLDELGVPAIALIETQGYKHFVVVKGVKAGRVLLGDPARGTRTVPYAEFVSMWNGIAFVIRDKASIGHEYFNSPQDWAVLAAAPFGTAMSRQTLSSFSVHLKGAMTNTF